MGPDSAAVEWLAIGAAVLCAVTIALLWERVHRWWGWVIRSTVLILAVLTAVAAGAAAVNRDNELYSSWAELFGGAPSTQHSGVPAGGAGSAATGRIVSFEVHGRASGVTLPVYAYLPPGYDGPALSHTRLPVLMALDGAPGSPYAWLKTLNAPSRLDHEIDAGRMAPTVVLFPYQTTSANHDSECVNAVGGAAIDTFLTQDVPSVVEKMFRVRTDGAAWGVFGFSAGAFCAVNLALRHPQRFAAAASFSGYFEPYQDSMTGDLFRGDTSARDQNSPLWRVRNLPVPRVSLYLAAAADDHIVMTGLRSFVAAARAPLQVTVVTVPVGGHSGQVWRELQVPTFDWFSAHLAAPLVESTPRSQSTHRSQPTPRPQPTPRASAPALDQTVAHASYGLDRLAPEGDVDFRS